MSTSKKTNYIVGCVSAMCIGVCLIIYGSVDYEGKRQIRKEVDRVGVVIDAGGSGTRMIVYNYANDTFKQLKYIICEDDGLTTYTEDELPTLRDKLNSCFTEGASILPKDKTVPLYFAATAGMRLLKLRAKETYDKVWKLVRDCIETSEFKLSKADTISGFEEAKWAWIAVNYLKHTIQTNSTFGTIDFGSSSFQLAFQQKNYVNKSRDVRELGIDGRKTIIYAHSYLCYGNNEIHRRFLAKLVKVANYTPIVTNPCFFTGYNQTVTSDYLWAFPCSSGDYARNYLGEDIRGPTGKTFTIEGTGNFTKCYQKLKHMINSNCTEGTCGLNNEMQPKLHGRFLAFSTFYYIGQMLNQTANSGKVGYLDAVKKLCGRSWKAYKKITVGIPKKYMYPECFQSTYGYYLLNDGLKFDRNAWSVDYVKRINGIDVGWSLGLIYTNKDNMYVRLDYSTTLVKKTGFIALIVIGAVCFVVGLFICFNVSRRSGIEVYSV